MTKPSKSRSGGSKARQLKLNPTTIAVRRAVALGLGLALASATPAFAACDTQLLSPVECQKLAAGANELATVDDPSWVLPVAGGQSAALKAAGVAANTKAYDVGLVAYGDFVHVENADTITANVNVASGYAVAYGAYIIATDVARLDNSGAISAIASSGDDNASAYGALVFGTFSGISAIANEGTISAEAQAGGGYNASATGAFSIGNVATVVNDGDIEASAHALYGAATATAARSYALWGAIYNYGDLTADASADYGQARAIGAESYGYFGSSIVNEGDITAVADAFAGAATAFGASNSAVIYGAYLENAGGIAATANADYGSALAAGSINIASFLGPAITTNSGDISAHAEAYAGDASAFGAYNYGYAYDSHIINSGSIDATAIADGGGTAQAIGAFALGFVYSDAAVVNSGDISANAQAAYGTAVAVGAYASATIAGSATVYNSGSIAASADAFSGTATAWGARTSAYYAGIVNDGDISASASADFGFATAYGAYVDGKYAAVLVNAGDIAATASTESGVARAYGANVAAKYLDAYTSNSGDISASAEGFAAISIGSIGASTYGDAVLDNSGTISASASGTYAYAYGAVALGNYDAVISNAGSIAANADGDYGVAIGVFARGAYGDVSIVNTGDISASGSGGAGAIAVTMDSDGTNVLVNTGDISADSESSYAVAVLSSTYATALIYNEGSISGAIQTGDLDDLLDNSGSWTATGLSDFGGGDDVIVNSGSILVNGVINLGGYAATGNVFENSGELLVRGSGNFIHMGGGNPLAFDNGGGSINFVDGDANDRLNIFGDFAGSGSLWFDLDGASGGHDSLFIDGSVAADSVSTINGQLLSPISSTQTFFNVVGVRYISSADNFVIGNISTPADVFLTFDFELVTDLNMRPSSLDGFSIRAEVSGLSARGELSGALVPGVQNLWHAATGTLAQREGALRQRSGSGFDVWLRGFSSDGDIAPGAGTRNFGAGGNQVFEQQSSGIEAGLSYHVHEGFSVGLLFGRADADLDPASGGSASLDADTVGGYATFTHGDFYIDASLRRMDIDIEGAADGVAVLSDSAANGFSLESGYAFEVGEGLRITPQLQYSSLDVDDIVVESSWGDFVAADNDSRRTRLGVSFDKSFDEGNGRSWTPFLSLSAVRESAADNGYEIDGVFTGDSRIDGDSTLLETGISSRFGNWSLFGSLHWQDGDALDSVFGGQLALRYNFGGGQ